MTDNDVIDAAAAGDDDDAAAGDDDDDDDEDDDDDDDDDDWSPWWVLAVNLSGSGIWRDSVPPDIDTVILMATALR